MNRKRCEKHHVKSLWKRIFCMCLVMVLIFGIVDCPLFREVTYAQTYTLSGELRMKKGQVGTLEMDNVDTSGNISWKSSNTSVARVKQIGTKCEVTGVGGGTCWITFTTNGTSYRRKLIVTGKKLITLSQSSVVISKGKKVTLQLYHAKKKVTWKSSNKKVASVSQKGVVTAKKKGNAVITAKTNGKAYKCKVKVVVPGGSGKSTSSSNDPSLNSRYVDLSIGETFQLKLNGVNGTVDWQSQNPQIADISQSGLVTAISSGEATITAYSHDTGSTYYCYVTVTDGSGSGNTSDGNSNPSKQDSSSDDSAGMSFTTVKVPSLSAKEKKVMNAGNQALKAYTNARLLTEKMEAAAKNNASASELEKITNQCVESWRIAMNLSEMTEEMGAAVEKETAKAKSIAQRELMLSLFDNDKKDDKAVKEWAEKITKMYDAGKPGKQVRTLAQQLGVDAKTAYEQLKAAQDIIKNGALADAASYDKMYKIAAGVKATAKVAGFVVACYATGGVAVSVGKAVLTTTSLCVNGIDAVIETCNTGSMIVMGEDHVCTVALDKLNQKTSKAAAWTGLFTGNWSSPGVEEFQYIGESLVDFYQNGKIMGGTWETGALKWKLFDADSDKPVTVKRAMIETGFSESKADELVKSLEEKPQVEMVDWSQIPEKDLDELISDTDVVSTANNPEDEIEKAYTEVTGKKYIGTEKDTDSGKDSAKDSEKDKDKNDGKNTGNTEGYTWWEKAQLSDTAIDLAPGETKKLTLTLDGKDVSEKATWKVYPGDDVVKVDEKGNVTALSVGSAQVSVFYKHDDPSLPQEYRDHTVEYTCKVTVKGEIHLNHTSLSFHTLTSKQLLLLDEYGNPITSGVTWSVDNEKMYSIDQTGLIVCEGPGVQVNRPSITGYNAIATYQGKQYICKLTWKKNMPSIDEGANDS